MKKKYIAPKAVAVDLAEDLCDIIATSEAPAACSNDELDMDVKQECSGGINSLWDEEW